MRIKIPDCYSEAKSTTQVHRAVPKFGLGMRFTENSRNYSQGLPSTHTTLIPKLGSIVAREKRLPPPNAKKKLGIIKLVDLNDFWLEKSAIWTFGWTSRPGVVSGETKLNQDALFAKNGVFGDWSVFALFDGHGMVGHRVANFLALNLEGTC